MVVATLPTSTTNITGFFIMFRGSSFTTESQSARRTIFMSQMDFDFFLSAIVHQKVLPTDINRCSSMGPRLSAGKKVSAPTIRITPTSNTLNNGVVTGNVPSEGGTYFFFANFPAIASIGMIMKNRPTSMVIAPALLYQRVFPFNPPKAEPLLPAMDVNAYRIWVSP